MKKIFLFLIITILIGLCSGAVMASEFEGEADYPQSEHIIITTAEESTEKTAKENPIWGSGDSVDWSGEEYADVQRQGTDTILRIAVTASFFDLAQDISIEELVCNSSILYLGIPIIGNKYCCHYIDGERWVYNQGVSEWEDLYEYVLSPHKILDWSVNVEKIYCLGGGRSGRIIYYQTDEGDYILYQGKALTSTTEKELYLFNDVEFKQACKDYLQKLSEMPPNNETTGLSANFFENLVDISDKRVSPHMSIGETCVLVAVLLLLGGTTALIIWKKKKKKRITE